MNKLNIFVCENFAPEFLNIVERNGFDDVVIRPYPCMCENKNNKPETLKIMQKISEDGDEGLILCSKHCDAIKLSEGFPFNVRAVNYCFNHLANEKFLDCIIQRGGYIIGLGWLNNWREHIENMGFDRDTARLFFKDFCKELVFFDAGINDKTEEDLKELSKFLDLPYVIIPFELEPLQLMMKSTIYEWKLNKKTKDSNELISQIQAQCAEYSAIFDLISKIASYTNKRDTIEKIKEIFMMVFGAQNFNFYNNEYNISSSDLVSELISNSENSYILLKEENKFWIKIEHNSKLYGIIEVKDFLFPQHIERYLNFALEISKILGLVLSNIEQYEKIMKSEKELQYLSFHDSLTGLYNRTYINEFEINNVADKYLTVFAFDIDRLKYVNDNFGHSEGDKLISGVANIIKNAFRETDIVARIGGDEFVAILPECDENMAGIFKERIEDSIRKYNSEVKEAHLNISFSIGFSSSVGTNYTLEELMQKADVLMYKDKLSKRRN